MKLLYDFFPLLVFFIAYKIAGIYVATGILIIASAIQIGYLWLRHRRIETMHVITFILVAFFGGITIILHDAMYLKWKVSIVNWLFGCAFLATQWVGKKTAIQFLFESSTDKQGKHQPIDLPAHAWQRLNLMWALYFMMIGCINIYIAYHYSTATWVNFKVFGMLGLTVVFIIIQSFYLYKHLKHHHG